MCRARTLPIALLTAGWLAPSVVTAIPISAQEGSGPQRRVPRVTAGHRVALPVANLALQLPNGWEVGTSAFANAAVIYNAPGGDRGPARIMITTEPRTDHRDAVSRLPQIARETTAPADYFAAGGWPALERRHLVLKQMPGSPPGGDSGDEMVLHITVAIAAGRTLVRLEASLPPEREAELGDEIRAIARTASFPTRGDPGRVEADVERLRTEEPPARPAPEPQAALPPEPPPSDEPAFAEDEAGVPLRAVSGGSEISVAVSDDGQDVVVATNSGYAASSDAGETFSPLRFPTFPPTYFRVNGDPSVAVGLSGSFYYALIGFPSSDGATPPSAATNSTAISVSTNGGQNFAWRADAVVCQGGGVPGAPGPGLCFADQEHIAADRFNAGGGGDQIYSTWRNFDGVDQDPALVCSQDGANNWTAPLDVGPGVKPRIGIGQDGFVYVIYLNGNNVEVRKYSSCANGLALQAGFPQVVDTINEVSCPVPGLDRCTGRNTLASYTVAVDDTDPNHVYAAYATNTVNGVNENVLVRDSLDGGSSWPAGRVVQLHPAVNARRFMPWLCVVGGTAHASWYDMRFATVGNNDLTDFFRGSAFLDGADNLVAGAEVQITGMSDPLCASGWPCATDRFGDSESCSVQPQPAGVCSGTPTAVNPRGVACDFSDCGVCSAGLCIGTANACASDSDCARLPGCACTGTQNCLVGRGCPKYGDYNYVACSAGRVYTAWASATSPPGLTPVSPGNRVDTFFEVELVCCEPRIEAPEDLALPATCAGDLGTADLEVCNTGFADLEISGITSSNVQFSVPATYPVAVPAGDCETFTARFEPTSRGFKTATLTIASNDPVKPEVMVAATGTGKGLVSITCPGTVVAPNDPGQCSALVDPGTPTWNAEGCPVDITSLRSDGLPINAPYPVGLTTVTWTATDGGGNNMSCPQTVQVNDVEPPVISNATAEPDSLWPPNHKMVPVNVAYEVMDNCDAAALITCELTVASNEPVNGTGDGDTEPDWIVLDEHDLELRSERAGGGNGRVYTQTITCADTKANESEEDTTVTVPKSRRK